MYSLEILMVGRIMYYRSAEPRCCDSAGLAGNELQTFLPQ
jgi:hypothetical protein